MNQVSPEKPKYLYKYQPYSVQSLDNLKNRILWFSKPSAFNDPFDCSVRVPLDIEKLTMEELVDFAERTLSKNGVGSDIIDREIEKLQTPEGRKNLECGMQEKIREMGDRLDQCGVACFTEDATNLLMWSHYAQGHTGFCMEFDTSFEPFSKASPVIYRQEIPDANPLSMLKDIQKIIDARLKTKFQCWDYEKEWRVLHSETNKGFCVHVNGLTGVYFGCRMPYVHQEVICLILRGSPTQFYRMKEDEKRFAVLPEKIEYTPYNYEQDGSEVRAFGTG